MQRGRFIKIPKFRFIYQIYQSMKNKNYCQTDEIDICSFVHLSNRLLNGTSTVSSFTLFIFENI